MSKALFRGLIQAKTTQDVENILKQVEPNKKVRFLPVGGSHTNLGTIGTLSQPISGVIERITNAMDAIIEREFIERGCPKNIKSPRQAVQEFFNIKNGKLRDLPIMEQMTKEEKNNLYELAKKITVTIHESGVRKRPTVDIRDLGVGIPAEKFSSTILSLNQNNKMDKFHLLGTYGMGGSTALAYSEYTLIVSRHAINKSDKVSFTIVRLNEGDVNKDKMGWFEYCVDSNTGFPIEIELPLEEFEPGTLVRHIAMDLKSCKDSISHPTGDSAWYQLNHHLFDSILPFTLHGTRLIDKRKDNKSQTEKNFYIYGSTRRLDSGGKSNEGIRDGIEYKNSISIPFKKGNIFLSYWVVAPKDDGSYYIDNYTKRIHPIIFTYNGQKQGEDTPEFIRRSIEMPFLENYLLIHVNCDNLDNATKREFFTSTREDLKRSDIASDIKILISEVMKSDNKLREINLKRRGKVTTTPNKIAEAIANRVSETLFGKGNGPRVSVLPKLPKPVEIIKLVDPVTMFEITSPDDKSVRIGGSFKIKFKSNALNKYFINGTPISFKFGSNRFAEKEFDVKYCDGYGEMSFTVKETVKPHTFCDLSLTLKIGKKTLSAAINLIAVEPQPATEKKQNVPPKIHLEWLNKTMPNYATLGFTEVTGAKCNIYESENRAEIFINEENVNYIKAMTKYHKQGEDVISTIKTEYGSAISVGVIRTEKLTIEEDCSDSVMRAHKEKFIDTVLSPTSIEQITSLIKMGLKLKD